ncbi:MAG: stage II sporulation protein P, partial [Chloroflexi bacterium]|nr:stage II sporulation protein P [Chloroflexota bacterium]
MKLSYRSFLWIVLAFLSFVTACQSGTGPTPADASRPRPTPAPVSTPTAAPAPSELTVCLG